MKFRFKITLSLMFIVLLSVALISSGCAPKTASSGQPQVAFYAFNSEPVLNWDPAVEFSNGIVVLNNVYETLLRYDPAADKLIPVLATDYTKSPDGLTWTFHIRKGVKFHDGTDLNAQAVKFSIDRTIKLNQGAAYIWGAVKQINVLDDYTVQFQLSYPAPIDLITSSTYAAFIISPTAVQAHPDSWLSQGNECGTGPYMLQSNTAGSQVVLTAFKGYWQGWQGKHFDKVVIEKVPETASRRQMLEKGDADITGYLPYEDVNAMKSEPSVVINVSPSFENLFFFMNTQKPPLNNLQVRQALSYAFPYQDVVNYCMGGYATQSRGIIPVGMWGHGDSLPQYSTDLDQAKALLKQAGYSNGGFTLQLTYMSGDESEKKAAELYKDQLAKLNIDLDVREMPWTSQWELAKSNNKSQQQDILAMYWWPDYCSPYSWLLNLFHSESSINYNLGYWYNQNYDSLVDDGNKEAGVDRQKATQMFIDAQKMVMDQAVAIPVYDEKDVYVTNKSFKGFVDNPAYPETVFFYNTYRG
jgi:peptide/nickel transport system substrate-binding protein